MTFRLPCLDQSIDTGLVACDVPLPPNTEDDCVLTLSSCWEHDDASFLTSKIQLLEEDARAVATKLLHTETWKTLQDLVQKMQAVGCLSVTGCCHKFSGLPLLYIFMTTGFKCLICRYGNNATINITAPPSNHLCANVWEAMCVLCKWCASTIGLKSWSTRDCNADGAADNFCRIFVSSLDATLCPLQRPQSRRGKCPICADSYQNVHRQNDGSAISKRAIA